MSDSKLLNVRIRPDLKKKAKMLAEEDGRSLSNWVKHLIKVEVNKADATEFDAGLKMIDHRVSRPTGSGSAREDASNFFHGTA